MVEATRTGSEISAVYQPNKCSATGAIIGSKDYASTQISIPELDKDGIVTKDYTYYVFCGRIRAQGHANECLTELCKRDGFLPK